MPDKFYYSGIPSPNGTIVPDDVFDVLMPVCTGAEYKVLSYIVRRTFGFKKEKDNISLSQLVDGIMKRKTGKKLDGGTGLSKAAVAVALKGLTEKGIIEVRHNQSKKKGYEPTTYRLRFADKAPLSRNQTRGSLKNGQGLVQKSDIQTTVLQETDIQIRNSNSKLEINNSKGNGKHHSPQAIGNILKDKFTPKTVEAILSKDIPEPLKAAVQIVSEELGDRKNMRSNLTRVVNLSQRAEKNINSFDQFLYEAMSITKQQGKQGSVRKRMPYFFGVLEELIGLKTTASYQLR